MSVYEQPPRSRSRPTTASRSRPSTAGPAGSRQPQQQQQQQQHAQSYSNTHSLAKADGSWAQLAEAGGGEENELLQRAVRHRLAHLRSKIRVVKKTAEAIGPQSAGPKSQRARCHRIPPAHA